MPFVLDVEQADNQDGIAHLRLIPGGTAKDEVGKIAFAIEDALERKYRLRYEGSGPHASTGWDVLERI